MIPDFILTALVVFLLIWVVFLLKKKEKHKRPENNPLIDRPENKILIDNILNNDTEGVKRSFESYRAAPHSKSQLGESAIELAIQKDNKYIVAYLIKYGAIPNAIEREEAFKSGNKEIIEMLETGNHLRLISEYEFFKKTK
ncbi:ankyrin repeat protein [Neobacillus niacini]|uniref:hypothetical protein n=1 Tax=Neobacillus niacini TaxID=86668 RepID=UPI002864C336|nr:hypothetical protein [Neobacillus niacini]MDR7080666.1 ankyrin repeat protein [Neobacillus niacini]